MAAAILAADQATKAAVMQALPLGGGVVVIPELLNLVHARNTGVAFGMLSGLGGWQVPLLVAVAVAIIAVLGVWIHRLGDTETGTRLALAAILGGAVGNVVDRLAWGHVVDFIDVHWGGWHYPAFNVADSAITLGAIALAWLVYRADARRSG
jgi:signal peptidase II